LQNYCIFATNAMDPSLLAYMIIPGLLVVWDRVLDHMEDRGTSPK